MPAGRYVRTALLGWIQGDAMPSPPASVWVHLVTTASTATVPGDLPAIADYAGNEVEPADWAAIVTGANFDTLSPTAALRFPPTGVFGAGSDEDAIGVLVTTDEDPGAGEIIGYAALLETRRITAGGVVIIGAGDLDLRA